MQRHMLFDGTNPTVVGDALSMAVEGLPPIKQTWNDHSRDCRFDGLARRVELHRLNLTLS